MGGLKKEELKRKNEEGRMKTYLLVICNFCIGGIFAQQQFPGQDIIGKTYNVFGEFANNKSIQRYPIFDFSKLEIKKDQFGHNLPSAIYIENISDHIITTVEGSSIKEYSNNLAEKAGLSGDALFFKASIDYSSTEINNTQDELFMYTYMDLNTKWRISMDTRNIDKMISMLDEQFTIDIEQLSPKELFDSYGTHFISSAYLGGRIDYITSTKLSNSQSKEEIKQAVEGSYKLISGYYSTNDNNTVQINKSTTKTKLNVVGGNSQFTNNIQNAEQYKTWAEGLVKSPVLCGFDDKSLVPIWMLTKNAARKADLEKYFNTQIITKYPFPTYFKKDNVLDNENFTAHYAVFIDGFEIIDDCDASTLLTYDESGDFQYSISVYENDNRVAKYTSPEGRYYLKSAGQKLEIGELVKFEFKLNAESTIAIKYFLEDYDEISLSDLLGNATNVHSFPFSVTELYNSKTWDGKLCYKQPLYKSSTCNANLIYTIFPDRDPTAVEFGNKGWKEFELGNYNECLNYSRKALEINNTLWYAQFNVALVYLIQKNPMAFQKYQTICEYCAEKETIKAAWQDILDYEQKHGLLDGSEPIKLLLKSKIN